MPASFTDGRILLDLLGQGSAEVYGSTSRFVRLQPEHQVEVRCGLFGTMSTKQQKAAIKQQMPSVWSCICILLMDFSLWLNWSTSLSLKSMYKLKIIWTLSWLWDDCLILCSMFFFNKKLIGFLCLFLSDADVAWQPFISANNIKLPYKDGMK